MKIFSSTGYIDNPKIGDLKLKINSMWDFGSRDICFKNSYSYDLEKCIDVKDGIIIGGTEKVKNTKWEQAEIIPKIVEELEKKGYYVSKNYKKLSVEEIPQMKGTL